ncbi:STAS domain-containing protein [Streptomyces sp. NPDC056479]|uniref:STAS domain-containing protein n=1 Tax=unclassified Streptomyces TaxID=2593676 RepID=UPI0036A830ED
MYPLADLMGWRAIGEITLATRPAWQQTMDGLAGSGTGVCHLELSAVTFADVAGVSVLAVAIQGLPAGRRVVVERPPASMERLLEMFWPDLRAIEVVAR